MMIPSNRFLFWFALLLPFSAMGALDTTWAGLAIVLFGVLGISSIADLAFGIVRARGIRVTIPPVLRMSRGSRTAIPVRIERHGSGGRAVRSVRVGLPLPPSIKSAEPALDVALPAGEVLSTEWPCTPGERGLYGVKGCHFEVASPLGLWGMRGTTPCASELRVYPALGAERRTLAALLLRRNIQGVHARRIVGQGREFEKLRDYTPGDSFEEIHWKATAKRGKPVTKLFQVEREQDIYVVIDASRLSARPRAGQAVLEEYISAALAVCLVAERQGDLFGVMAFSNGVRRFIRAGGGKAHYGACRETLHLLAADPVTPDFEEACAFIRRRIRRRALVIFLTDLSDPTLAESFVKNSDLISRQHVVFVCSPRQEGVEPLFSRAGTGGMPEVYTKLAGHMIWSKIREAGKALEHKGMRLALVDSGRLGIEAVGHYLSVKARQRL